MTIAYNLADGLAKNLGYYLGGKGGFLPPLIPNLKLWLDASDTATITKDGSNLVSQWNDKSGNGNNATQDTALNQPTYTANGQNGKPVIAFDGGDYLELPSGLYSIPTGANTVFYVAKRDTEAASGEVVFNFDASGINGYYSGFGATAGDTIFLNNSSDSNTLVNSGNTNTQYQIVTCYRSGTTQSIAVDGGTAISNTLAANLASVDQAIIGARDGSSLFLTGGIAEIIIYDRALSTAERLQIEMYLANKWGVTV